MRLHLLLGSLLVLTMSTLATACPMCKESIATPDPSAMPGGPGMTAGGLPSGFNTSVYTMLIGLFLVGGFVVGVIVRNVRSTNNAGSGFPVVPAKSHSD